MKKLKEEGKADTEHNRPIPEHDLAKIYQLGIVMHEIVNGSNVDLTLLPLGNENTYHYIAQRIAIFIIQSHFARRGREGIDQLNIADLEVFEHPKAGRFWRKVVGEASKNHKSDSEDLRGGGIILFMKNRFGFNPGQFLQDYIVKLDPKCPFLFPRPLR